MHCDIIIPIWNQLNYTKACIDSVFRFTQFPFKLILIDNGSEERTAQYLRDIQQQHPEQVNLIRNKENSGFIKAVNQGIQQSRAGYICLLNNDTEVTDGWLKEMIKIAEADVSIGIVNPNSNTLGCNPQKNQTPDTLAKDLKSLSGQRSELAWAAGFCMLIKRKVLEEIGLFDEVFGLGTFEDADFSKRAQAKGYFSVCAKAAYVYHRERRSFARHKRFDQDFERNRQIFHARWGRPQRLLYVLTEDNPRYLEKIRQETIKLARQGHLAWVFLKERKEEQENIKRHSNIYVFSLPHRFFTPISLWRILKRKKKFDKIYVDNEGYGKRLNHLKVFHKAEVIYAQ